MIKTYINRDGIEFKGLKYTGKNAEEFYNILNNSDNELGIFVPLGSGNPIVEDSEGLSFMFHDHYLELKKGYNFLYSKDTKLFSVLSDSQLKRAFEQVK